MIKSVAGLVLVLLLALAIREPIVGGIAAYALAAHRSFFAAVWLFQFDPDRRRGMVCFLFYIANAFWSGAFLALPTVFASAWIMTRLGMQIGFEHFRVSMIAWSGGVIATTLIGLWAIRIALKNRIKVWVHPRIKSFANDEFENLADDSVYVASQFNYAIFVVSTAVVFPLVAAFCFGVLALLVQPPFGVFENVLLPLFLLVVLPASLLVIYGCISSRIIARHPAECWSTSDSKFFP